MLKLSDPLNDSWYSYAIFSGPCLSINLMTFGTTEKRCVKMSW